MKSTNRADAQAPLHILLLCHFEPGSASTILEHVDAFQRFSAHHYYVLNNLGDLPWWIDLERFDALVIHYSLVASYDNYISPATRARIREFTGFKAAFVQDDYRWINDTVAAMALMRINALFGLAGQDIIDQVYSPARLPGVRRETVLTGYAPEQLARRAVSPLAERPIDVGYRARKLPAWIGSHTLQKWQIADRFLADAPGYGLKVDISYREEDRIYGEDWIRFVSSCKAVLGTESGASVCDFTGDIQRNVEAHVKREPDVAFETLRDLYFRDCDGRIMMNVISPRCFEAASLRTLMILYEGYYSGVLQPWRHYVPLRTDHSNMEQVVRMLRDSAEAQAIVDRAYHEVALNPEYTFKGLIEKVDRVIAEEYRPAARRYGYSESEYAWRLSQNASDLTRYATVILPDTGGEAPAAALLRKPSEEPARVPIAGDGPPYTVTFELAGPLELFAVHLVWAEPQGSATSGQIQHFRNGRLVRRTKFHSKEPTLYRKVDISLSKPVDRLSLTLDPAFDGGFPRLRDVRIDGVLHWRERARVARERTRQQLGIRFKYRLSETWMRFPAPVRSVLRRPVRAIYDAIVGRPD